MSSSPARTAPTNDSYISYIISHALPIPQLTAPTHPNLGLRPELRKPQNCHLETVTKPSPLPPKLCSPCGVFTQLGPNGWSISQKLWALHNIFRVRSLGDPIWIWVFNDPHVNSLMISIFWYWFSRGIKNWTLSSICAFFPSSSLSMNRLCIPGPVQQKFVD